MVDTNKLNLISKNKAQRSQDNQFGNEQDSPSGKQPRFSAVPACSGLDGSIHMVFDGDGNLEHDLKQDCGQQRDAEGIDDHGIPVFVEQVQNRQIHQYGA